MKASTNWLRALAGTPLSTDDIAKKLTSGGLEIEGVHSIGFALDNVVVAKVISKSKHPTKDKLTLVEVTDGSTTHSVVCGAPNVPEVGGHVALARVGTTMPNGMKIEPREVAGVASSGMLCSEVELGIGEEGDGILVIEDLVAEASSLLGNPVAQALKAQDDVLEIGITPNRPDALGHVGIARELCAHLKQNFVLPKGISQAELEALPPNGFAISIENAERCTRYLGLRIDGVNAKQSPFWLRSQLFAWGSRSIDSIVDSTNYVLQAFGHPIHAFDADKLEGNKIIVRQARAGEKLVTLDGIERALNDDDLVIADATKPIALAGVIGGKDSAVSASTKSILVEVAFFDPRGVRRSARRHGLHTDASHRFERGCDPNALDDVLSFAAKVILETSGGKMVSLHQATVREIHPKEIRFDGDIIEQTLGHRVDLKEADAILTRLGCTVLENGDFRIVSAPTFRPDLQRPIDLVEEVARMRGYQAIQSQKVAMPSQRMDPRSRAGLLRAIRRSLTASGLCEALTYSFGSEKDCSLFTAQGTKSVRLLNPISEERSVMRPSLLPGLLRAMQQTQRHQTKSVQLFDVARVFRCGSGDYPVIEDSHAAFVLSGDAPSWLKANRTFDFFDAKGVVESLFTALQVEVSFNTPESEARPAWFHPKRSAEVFVAGNPVGFVGETHPDLQEAMGLDRVAQMAELNLEWVLTQASSESLPQFKGLPVYPSMQRDITVSLREATLSSDVESALRGASELVEEVAILDVYRGQGVPEGRKSSTYRITYRDRSATLTDQRVEEAHRSVLANLESLKS